MDFEAIRDANPLSSVVSRYAKLRRAGREMKACCPFHHEKTPSFTIFADDRRYYCFGCGACGDVLDFLKAAEGVNLIEAAQMLGEEWAPTARPAFTPEPAIDRTPELLQMVQASEPVAGTIAARYLESRGIAMPAPDTLRFTRLKYGTSGPKRPVLLAIVTDHTDRLIGVQRTFLTEEARKADDVPKPKLSLGRIKGGAVRLGPPSAEIIVTEGVEDALSLQQETGVTAYASAGAGMMAAMALPEFVGSVIIGADADEAGERAAQEAGVAFVEAGRRARIIRPTPPHKDFNAELMKGTLA
jgi:DNA primase